jgi:glycosyltransferase involved in cell wall biosynthesis
MAVYNERPYLEKAVQSVLDQTFKDFEFIVINDGSADGSKEVLKNFSKRDDRIQLVNQENRGLTASLNRGLNMAQGKYIARMDGDDTTYPERFHRQIDFLESNPDVGVLGTQINRVNADDKPFGQWRLPTDSDLVGWQLFFNNSLCHPTVMMRHSLLQDLNGYADWATHAEDYELWTRAVLQSQLANLPETLHDLRRHGDSVTATKRKEQVQTCARATANLHRALLGTSVEADIAHFLAWMGSEGIRRGIAETGVEDFAVVHKYVRNLYASYVKYFLSGKSNIQVRRHALSKLDTLASNIKQTRGRSAGIVHKLRARIMLPRKEFFPWLGQAIRERISLTKQIF